MRFPVVDPVLLLLLVLFFGVQQRRRPQIYFRFWFAGWIFVLLSYLARALPGASASLAPVQRALSFDFRLAGVLTFLISLLPWGENRLRKAVLAVATIGLIDALIINAQQLIAVPRIVLALAVVLWQAQGFYIAYIAPKVLTPICPWRSRLILAICVGYAALLAPYVWLIPATNLGNLAVVEVLLCVALLWTKVAPRRGMAGYAGVVGFLAWAGFQLADMWLGSGSELRPVLYLLWDFPKYFVGFAMILKVLEEVQDEKMRLAETYRNLYEDFRLLYDSHPHPMWICSLEGWFLAANEAAVAEYGYEMQDLREVRLEELKVTGEPGAEEVEAVPSPSHGDRVQLRHKDGSSMWVNLAEREIRYLGQEARLVIARNITQQVMSDRELRYQAQLDVLTGLPNRQLLETRFAAVLHGCRVEDKRAALLTIDVDHFKQINDTYGHLVGDQCLQEVAARLKSTIRKQDAIARIGGEEFAIVVSGLRKPGDEEKVAASLLRVFAAPVELEVGALAVTVSIGVAVYPDDATDAATLRRLSDDALYRAKRSGRNRAVCAAHPSGRSLPAGAGKAPAASPMPDDVFAAKRAQAPALPGA